MIAAAVMLALLGAQIDVTFAPDQPLPMVYVDEPLIIELRADSDVNVDAVLTLETDNRPPIAVSLDTLSLRAGTPHWRPITGIPPQRGRYTALLTMTVDGETVEKHGTFCRVDRPASHTLDFVIPTADGFDATDVQVIRAAPFGWSALVLQGASALAADIRKMPLPRWMVRVTDPQTESETVRLAFPETAWWLVDIPGDISAAASTVHAIDEGRGQLPLAVAIDSPAAARSAVESELHRSVTHWYVPADSAASVRDALDSALAERGVEHMPAILSLSPPENGPSLVAALVGARHADARAVLIPFEHVFADGVLSPQFPYFCAMAHRLGNARYIGELDIGEEHHGDVFVRDGWWTLLLWTDGQPQEIEIPVGDTVATSAFDGLNNPVPLASPTEGTLTVLVTAEPQYIEGRGGQLVGMTARTMARHEAEALLDVTATKDLLAEGLYEALGKAASDNIERLPRRQFLLLLQAFPALEQVRQRNAEQALAITRLDAGLTRMLRHLCTVEQESGEVFIEPYQDLLARSDELTAQYVTGQTAGGTSYSERAEWLFGEITRRGEEARQLAAAGRLIEADAVASLTEWRARSLRYAMEAPATP